MPTRVASGVALAIGGLVIALGALGIAAPAVFLRTVRFFQTPPAIYLAAAMRLAVGLVLFRAAPTSRLPRTFRVLGILVVIGGLLTLFVGVAGGRAILDSWSFGGSGVVRLWAVSAVAVGAFIVYAMTPKRPVS